MGVVADGGQELSGDLGADAWQRDQAWRDRGHQGAQFSRLATVYRRPSRPSVTATAEIARSSFGDR